MTNIINLSNMTNDAFFFAFMLRRLFQFQIAKQIYQKINKDTIAIVGIPANPNRGFTVRKQPKQPKYMDETRLFFPIQPNLIYKTWSSIPSKTNECLPIWHTFLTIIHTFLNFKQNLLFLCTKKRLKILYFVRKKKRKEGPSSQHFIWQ